MKREQPSTMMDFQRPCTALLLLLILLAPHGLEAQVYSREYELIDYTAEAPGNPIAKLASRLEQGSESLEYRGNRGYFDSLLDALDIDPASQVLVFSGTSLQNEHISPQTPRSIYFNDETYVAWVQGSDIVEMAAVDDDRGLVFYLFHNEPRAERPFERTNQSCLVCHDSAGTMGGGVPELMVLSGIYGEGGSPLARAAGGHNTHDGVPLEERWGGWYVTGRHGEQQHLGNLLLPDKGALERIDDFRRDNLDTLRGEGFFDTEPYLRATSDIVALLVLEHQMTVQNGITYVKFKAPAVLGRIGEASATEAASWGELPKRAQRALTRMLDELLDSMLFVDAVNYETPISGSEDFRAGFESRGPVDSQGRSLRELELETRLLQRPLSYLIHSRGFNTLPAYAKDYLFMRLADILEGRDTGERYAHISEVERAEIRAILYDTLPVFRSYLSD